MTTTSPFLSSTHFVKHHEYHTLLPTLLLVDEIIIPNKAIASQTSSKRLSFTQHLTSSPTQITRTNHHISSPTSPPQSHHTISSPKQSTHHISSSKQTPFSHQTSQSQPPPPPSRPRTHTQPSSQPSSPPKPSSPTSQQSSTLHFLSTHEIAPYTTPSCSITLTSFQPSALSDAVEATVLTFPSLHDLIHTQPNRSVHPSLLPSQVHSQSTPTRYRLHPTHRKTPSLPNLSKQQTSIEPLPISSMWETPQYEKITSS